MKEKVYFAADLGATSGRTMVGRLKDGQLLMEELTRFDNPLITIGGHVYWDLYALYREITLGLKAAAQKELDVVSIGIDTWGCDFVFVGKDGALLRNPMAYRDPHTAGIQPKYFAQAVPQETVYAKTGIQFMDFNSLFQLYAMKEAGNSALENADKVLFIPDALSYLLTGVAVCEYTVASTSQILNPNTRDLDEDLLASVGLKRSQFGPMTEPGTVIGTLTEEVQRLTGLGAVPVVAVAGHDTASAVAAVPAKNEKFAYLSSGTWSLMGIESPKPLINERSRELNFTNEGGIEGTTRFLKNICGMWLYECCRREWKAAGEDKETLAHPTLLAEAQKAEPFRSLINPDDPMFANPSSMIEAIATYCEKTGQPVPETHGQYCRLIFDSLALRYRQVFSWLQEQSEVAIEALHIIGGGSLNDHLNQATANACGVSVIAGPQEATAFGNIMLQAKACGEVADIWAMRDTIAKGISLKTYQPQDAEAWAKAFEKFQKL